MKSGYQGNECGKEKENQRNIEHPLIISRNVLLASIYLEKVSIFARFLSEKVDIFYRSFLIQNVGT